MLKRILIGSYEVPGYGGASTFAYRLFEDLTDEGWDAVLVNLIGQADYPKFRAVYEEMAGNPRQLANVHNLVLERAPYYPSPSHSNLAELIARLGPDVMLGIGYIAALLLKSSAPAIPLIFITTGCNQAKKEIAAGRAGTATEILERADKRNRSREFTLQPRLTNVQEGGAVANADLILVHSEMTRVLFGYYFPGYADRIFPETLWLAEWISRDAAEYAGLRKTFAERDIDLLFIASDWKRPEKNWDLVREIIARRPDWNIHVVGNRAEPVGRATYHGLLTRREQVFELLGRARVLASPSRFDAAPGVLWEAAEMGCNVVASKNCGNWQLCDPQLVAEPFQVEEFVRRIQHALAREYHPNPEAFLRPSARQTLSEILEVF